MLEVVLLNLLSQALWELGLSPAVRAFKRRQQADLSAGGSPFGEIATAAAASLSSLDLPALDSIEAVLEAPEVREIVRDLYVFRLGEAPDGIAAARRAFVAYWQRTMPDFVASAEGAFQALLHAADAVLTAAIRDGSLIAHDTRDAMRQQVVVDHLRAVERKIDLLSEPQLSLGAIAAFEESYRTEVEARFGHITPPDFHSAPRLPIDALYVVPTISPLTNSQGEPLIDYDAWIADLDRCVVLGNPGAGKSTLTRKLSHDLAGGTRLAGRLVTPATVVLRDYGADRRSHAYSIREFLEVRARVNLQLDPPPAAFDYLLTNGRFLVVFDGLDELLDTSYRQEIRNDVESFCRRYPAVAVVVTSRVIGYEQAPLNPLAFTAVRINDFDDERVNDYAHKWFHLDQELTEPQQDEKAASFVAESAIVPDLRSNPLLLALMCNLYRGQNYIPRNRPDVYESCARMLFEVWDRSRGIEAVLPIAEHLRPAMQYLAYWIYSDESLRGGVTREQLVDKSAEFLLRWRFDDPHVARHAAEEFVDFCRGRAWVFADLGSTEQGEDLFQFTHQTFLEFFAASYLVTTCETNQALIEVLEPHIVRQEWDVVAQIAFQLRSRTNLGAASDLLERLLDPREASREEHNALNFSVRGLGFLVPTPTTVRRVVVRATDVAVQHAAVVATMTQEQSLRDQLWAGPLLSGIIAANQEVAPVAHQALVEKLEEHLPGDAETASAAGGILLELAGYGRLHAAASWAQGAQDVCTRRRERLMALLPESELLAIALAQQGVIGLERLLEVHGVPALFRSRPSWLSGGAWFVALAGEMLFALFRPQSSVASGLTDLPRLLTVVGAHALATEMPWMSFSPPEPFIGSSFTQQGLQLTRDANQLGEAAALGTFCLAATDFELRMRKLPDTANETRAHLIDQLGPLLVAILDTAAVGGGPGDSGAGNLVARWVNLELDFVTRFDSQD